MKYIVISRKNWALFHSDEELKLFLDERSDRPETRFENGLDALGKGFPAADMLAQGEYAIVRAGDVVLPVKQEVETVTKTTKWVLPALEQPKAEKKWRRCVHSDIGKLVFPDSIPGASPRSPFILDDVLIGCRQTDTIGYVMKGQDYIHTSAWIYD